MEQTKLKALELNAAKARLYGVQMVHDAASGHPGGSMSCMDVLTYLYFAEMRVDPKNPHDPGRDRFVMSKGHCSPAMYPVLALRGFFPVEDLKMFRRIDGHMSGHVEMKYVPGVDMSTGSLGQGISVAVGMALAGKVAQKDYRVYAILGDGEVAEGQVWEAMMAANKYHLDNLVCRSTARRRTSCPPSRWTRSSSLSVGTLSRSTVMTSIRSKPLTRKPSRPRGSPP